MRVMKSRSVSRYWTQNFRVFLVFQAKVVAVGGDAAFLEDVFDDVLNIFVLEDTAVLLQRKHHCRNGTIRPDRDTSGLFFRCARISSRCRGNFVSASPPEMVSSASFWMTSSYWIWDMLARATFTA